MTFQKQLGTYSADGSEHVFSQELCTLKLWIGRMEWVPHKKNITELSLIHELHARQDHYPSMTKQSVAEVLIHRIKNYVSQDIKDWVSLL